MIKKVLFKKEKKTYLEDQKRDVVVTSKKIYFVEDISKDYHCSDGVFCKEDLKKTNALIKSNKDVEVVVFNADFIDSYKGIKKTAQTIPLKDLGFILAEVGINKKMTVVDTGSGSGGCACFISKYCKKVYTYDIEEKNLEQTRNNIKYFELKNVIAKKQDVYEKIPNKNVDAIILDLPEPWKAIKSSDNALKIGGFIIAYCPQIIQSQQFINSLPEGYYILKTVEIIERDWKVIGNVVRPISLSNIHSGFITIARKIN